MTVTSPQPTDPGELRLAGPTSGWYDELWFCWRCRVHHLVGDFRCDHCGWCADDLGL